MGITPIVDQNSVHFFSLLVCLFEIPVLTKVSGYLDIVTEKNVLSVTSSTRFVSWNCCFTSVFASWTAIAMQRIFLSDSFTWFWKMMPAIHQQLSTTSDDATSVWYLQK